MSTQKLFKTVPIWPLLILREGKLGFQNIFFLQIILFSKTFCFLKHFVFSKRFVFKAFCFLKKIISKHFVFKALFLAASRALNLSLVNAEVRGRKMIYFSNSIIVVFFLFATCISLDL